MFVGKFAIFNRVWFSRRAAFFCAAFFCAAIFGANQNAHAQTVAGKVVDADNRAIERAEVALLRQNAVVSSTKTNDAGEFALDANNQNGLRLRVRAADFAVFEQPLSDAQAPLAIVLQPENVSANVVVTIAGNETRLAETAQSVVVLNRQTIEQTAAQTVDDQLRQVPGFTLFRRASSRTQNPTAQGANLRGTSGSGASRTTVLFDGVSLNDAFGNWTYWSRIPRAAVEQIEVLRGGASSVYGSGGLSGAINIVSEKTNDDKSFVRVETSAGTQKTFDGSVFASTATNGWSISFAGETFQTNGYFPTPEAERGAADARANSRHDNAFLTIGKRFGENFNVFARGNIFAERRDNGTNLQKNRTYFRQAIAGADFSDQTFGAFAARVFVDAQVYDQTFSAVSPNRNAENLTRVQRVPSGSVGANLFWSRVFFDSHTVSANFENRRVRGFSDETIIGNNRATAFVGAGGREQTFAVSAQDFWRATSRLNLNFGARFDFWRNQSAASTARNLIANNSTITNFPDRAQTAFSPNVGAVYRVSKNLSATAAFSRSFRAATLNELYRAFRVGSVLTVANENLIAERAANFETGARLTFARNKFNLRANAFATTITNPIVNVTIAFAPDSIIRQRQNLGRTRSNGLELDFEARLRADLTVSAGYLLADARVREFAASVDLINKFLPQVARQQFAFQTFYRPKNYSIGLQARTSGAQFDDDLNRFRLRPFFTLDIFASRRLPKNAEIFVAAENVFNNRFDIALTPNRVVGAPRFVRAGVRFSFGAR